MLTPNLPLPESPEAFTAAIRTLDLESAPIQAKRWADEVIASSLWPATEDLWLVRQCFLYMTPATIAPYLSANAINTGKIDIERFWVGSPPCWEGAVKMVEAGYYEAGWQAVLYPSVAPGFTPHQVSRLFRELQKTGSQRGKDKATSREYLFTEGFTTVGATTPSEMFWNEPQRWLTDHRLNMDDQVTIWATYALLGDPAILDKLAKPLRWHGWKMARQLIDWDALVNPHVEVRKEAALQLLKVHYTKAPNLELPTLELGEL